jgi:hypothetical protein
VPPSLRADLAPDAFLAAPADQCVPGLDGKERIYLERLVPGETTVDAHLPGPVVEGRLYMPGSAPRPIALAAQTLRIDLDRRIATLTYRGSAPLAGAAVFGAAVVTAGTAWPAEVPWSPDAAALDPSPNAGGTADITDLLAGRDLPFKS